MASKKQNDTAGEPSAILARAVKQLLRPLVALLIDHGFTYSWLVRNLKPIYLEVAQDEFQIDGKPQTDSRISLLTGLDRKDIRRLREKDSVPFSATESTFIGAQLSTIWMSDPRFLDKNGDPAPLPRLQRKALKNETGSFEELFTMVTKSIKPRAFLDEWVRIGAVTLNENDEVCIDLDSFVSSKSFEEKIFYLGKNIHDHLAASRTNILSDPPPFFERCVYHDHLSDKSVETLSEWSRDKGMEILKSVNAKARSLKEKDAKTRKTVKRMHLGIYFYSDDS